MMGFGAMGPGVWLMGIIAMAAVWGGVWWLLSVVVFHWPSRAHGPRRGAPPGQINARPTADWEQPRFAPPAGSPATAPKRPLPNLGTPHESDLR